MQLLLVRMMTLLMPVLVWPVLAKKPHMIPNMWAGRIRRLRCSPLAGAIFLACVSSVEEVVMEQIRRRDGHRCVRDAILRLCS